MNKFVLTIEHDNGDNYIVSQEIKGRPDLELFAKGINTFMDSLAESYKRPAKDMKEALLFLLMDEAKLDKPLALTKDYLHERVEEWKNKVNKE